MSILALMMTVALAQAPTQPIKLAAPTWKFVGVEESKGEFFADYLAQQIALSGVRVTTAAEIQSLLGFERQKALLGCSTDSCTAELAGALGVDGMILGSLATIGKALVVNVKVVKASDGRQLAVFSQKLANDEELLDWLTRTARELSTQVRQELGGKPVSAASTAPPSPVPSQALAAGPPMRSRAWIPAAAGGALLLAGGGAWYLAKNAESDLRTGPFPNYQELEKVRSAAEVSRGIAYAGVPLGVLGLGVAAWMAFWGPPAPVAVVPSPDGAAVVWAGVLP
ncbi:MAG: hypothetical protein M3Y59_13890 [Myxococcota bacterium]|nr:hypothetical protein [Myxococcota bacterium]